MFQACYSAVRSSLRAGCSSTRMSVHVPFGGLPGVAVRASCLECGLSEVSRGRAILLCSMDSQVCMDREVCQGSSKTSVLKKSRKSQHELKGRSAHKKNRDWRWNISPKAVDLVKKVSIMPDVKEEVYTELDKWVAFQEIFPIVHIKQALQVFEQKENWNRVIQISKWMLSKGQGKTLGTYKTLLVALDKQGRNEEAEELWKNTILKSSWSIPNTLISYALAMHERHNKPVEVIKLFTSMEDSGRNLGAESAERAARAYEKAGFLEKKQQVLRKYNIIVEDGGTSSGEKT